MRFSKAVVKYRIPILILTVLLMIPAVIGIANTRINYDMLNYLPEDMDTIIGQNELMEDFGKGAFSFIIVEDMPNKDVAALKAKIEQVDHVDTVIWYDTLFDLSVPMELLPDKIYTEFNTDHSTMMAVFFDSSTSADITMDAIREIRALCGKQCYVSGMSALVTDLKDLCEQEEPIYVGIAVALACGATLLEKSGDLVSGINKLAEGAAQLKAGAESLDSGAARLQAGAAQLSSGLNTLNANSSSLNGGARQVFSSLLSMANTQLSEAGLSVPALTIDNYASVLDGVIASLDDTAVYQAALEQVTATVNANRGMIEEKVTEAVQAQVEAEVSAQVTAAVQETVTQAVHENEAQFRAAVIQQALGMTVEEYKAAIEAGLVTQEQQDAVNAAVEAAMQAEIDTRMQREEIQAQINAVTQQTVGEQMQSDEIQALIASNTELQVQQAISEAMSSDAVQAQLSAAAEGAKSVIALKSSLDSYNAFYLGLITYTSGVSSAAAGANELKTGADALKAGTSELSAGAAELLQGIQTMKDSAPALVDGITQLRDGSMELSDGLKQFNEEGIQKLIEAVDGDLDGLSNRIRVTADVAKHYTSFSGISEDMDGDVKFIYKTDSIE